MCELATIHSSREMYAYKKSKPQGLEQQSRLDVFEPGRILTADIAYRGKTNI